MPDPPDPPPRWRDPAAVRTAALAVVAAAAGWWLLRELAPVVRPLLFAVILGYVILPYHARLRNRVSGAASLALLGGAAMAVVAGLAVAVYASALGLADELPALQKRAVGLFHAADDWLHDHAPWLTGPDDGGKQLEERLAAQAAGAAAPVLAAAAGVVGDAVVVGLYLFFLLAGAAKLPDRVRAAYPPDRADEILKLAGAVNAAIVSYLKAKVKSGLILAVPAGLVLAAFGVRFAVLWAVLTFLCNFIPYVGSVVSYSLPVGFAVLQLPPGWQPAAVAGLVLACHLGAASVEPMLLGRAVGLSPLVVLGSLAFWGLLWGVPGMFLAVPLTVVAVIVAGHFASTRPLSRLLGGG